MFLLPSCLSKKLFIKTNRLITLEQIALYFKGFEYREKMSMHNCFNILKKTECKWSSFLHSTAFVIQRQEM